MLGSQKFRKKNKKKIKRKNNLKLINYFYILFKIYFIYFK